MHAGTIEVYNLSKQTLSHLGSVTAQQVTPAISNERVTLPRMAALVYSYILIRILVVDR